MTTVVPIGGLELSADPACLLITHGLGSCIAVMAYDRVRRLGGMLHFQLPSSELAPARAVEQPGLFADTGVRRLLDAFDERGSRRRDLVVKVAGGASLHGDRGVFDVGRRNHTTLRRILWSEQLLVAAEDVGGCCSRTARLYVETGQVTIQSGGEVRTL